MYKTTYSVIITHNFIRIFTIKTICFNLLNCLIILSIALLFGGCNNGSSLNQPSNEINATNKPLTQIISNQDTSNSTISCLSTDINNYISVCGEENICEKLSLTIVNKCTTPQKLSNYTLKFDSFYLDKLNPENVFELPSLSEYIYNPETKSVENFIIKLTTGLSNGITIGEFSQPNNAIILPGQKITFSRAIRTWILVPQVKFDAERANRSLQVNSSGNFKIDDISNQSWRNSLDQIPIGLFGLKGYTISNLSDEVITSFQVYNLPEDIIIDEWRSSCINPTIKLKEGEQCNIVLKYTPQSTKNESNFDLEIFARSTSGYSEEFIQKINYSSR